MSLTLPRAAIILFCLWQIAAVGAYALPDAAKDPLAVWLRGNVQPIVRPYILLTSQWQQWNIFSPDPLQRVTTYSVEVDHGDAWGTLQTWSPQTVSALQHAHIFKMLGRLLEGTSPTLPLIEHFLRVQCDDFNLPPGTHLRLAYQNGVLPRPMHVFSVRSWVAVRAPLHTIPGSEILCGWPGIGIPRTFAP